MFNFLHLELTSRCSKDCWMCGRRKIERDHPELAKWGDMPIEMVEDISWQVPRGTMVHFHNNGEPLLYPELGEALRMFPGCIKHLDTNGKLLVDTAGSLLHYLDVLTISVIPLKRIVFMTNCPRGRHPDSDEQLAIVKKFLEIKGNIFHKPLMVYRLLGDIDQELKQEYRNLPGIVVTRVLHDPLGSYGYEKSVTIPEYGICQELLTHLAIDRHGDVSICVRFDPERKAVLGNVKEDKLVDIWNGQKRKNYRRAHLRGDRASLPLCDKCDYWGVPVG